MGMTIDEHIVQLKKLKSFHNGSYGASIKFAIETMRKYQKIEEIYKNWSYGADSCDCMKDIERVIENGKID